MKWTFNGSIAKLYEIDK